jgi:hypothetical protein
MPLGAAEPFVDSVVSVVLIDAPFGQVGRKASEARTWELAPDTT